MRRRPDLVYLAAIWSTLLLLLTACTTARAKEDFDRFQVWHPERVFSPNVSEKVKQCLKDFGTRLLLPNGLSYGESARNYQLRNKTLRQVTTDMRDLGCSHRVDFIRDPLSHAPKLFRGETIPLWVFVCPDGGVIRVKPQGDPLSTHRPQLHGSKALRYPFDAKFENYSDEVVKVDDEGIAVPKSRGDLGPVHLMTGWGEDAHMDLRP